MATGGQLMPAEETLLAAAKRLAVCERNLLAACRDWDDGQPAAFEALRKAYIAADADCQAKLKSADCAI